MARRPLDSDELGRKGESIFAGICTDAKLVANPASVDRKGWDFLVEWRQPQDATEYDDRNPTIAVRVQVKTVWEGAKSVKLRLSSAEDLAKDAHPAFIYVAVISDELTLVRTHLIHLRGAFLEDILRRLRKARFEGNRPNQLFFSIPLISTEQIGLDGASFRQFVEAAVDGSMHDYALAKQAELDAGKGAMRITARLAIETDDPFDEAAEIFLGRRDAKIVDFAAFSTRFGIELPDQKLTTPGGTMRVTPDPSTTCTLSLRRSNGQVLRFDGDLYRAPRIALSPLRGRIIVRTSAFDLTLDADLDVSSGGITMNMSLDNGPDKDTKLTADEWASVCLFYAGAGDDGATLEIQAHDTPEAIASTSVTIDERSQSALQRWQYLADLALEADAVFRHAGLQGWKLPLAALWGGAEKISTLNAMIYAPTTLLPACYKLEDDTPGIEWPASMLYFDRLDLDGDSLACAAKSNLAAEDGSASCTATLDSLVRLERIAGSDGAFFQFIDQVCALTKIESYCVANPTVHNEEVSGAGGSPDIT